MVAVMWGVGSELSGVGCLFGALLSNPFRRPGTVLRIHGVAVLVAIAAWRPRKRLGGPTHCMIIATVNSSSRTPTPRPPLSTSPLESAKRLIISSSEHRVFTRLCCDTVDASTPTLFDLHETSRNNAGPTLIDKVGKRWNAPHSFGH
jgi:hypothetical protein